MSRLLLLAVVFLAVECLSSSRAVAHAILVESQPAARATVPPGQSEIVLRFNSRIDHARSRLALRIGQAERALAIDPASPADVLATSIILVPGSYNLCWQVLAVDGHITRGEVPLTVQAP